MRLDKCLADCGLGTRSEVKSLLKAKRITVNGKVVTNGKVQVNPETDEILFDGEKIQYEEFVYIMMNKPKGVVSATEDNLHKTVLDLINPLYFKKGVFPVGRLDIDTNGLLFLTNDGEWAHGLVYPRNTVPKTSPNLFFPKKRIRIVWPDSTPILPTWLPPTPTGSPAATRNVLEKAH